MLILLFIEINIETVKNVMYRQDIERVLCRSMRNLHGRLAQGQTSERVSSRNHVQVPVEVAIAGLFHFEA